MGRFLMGFLRCWLALVVIACSCARADPGISSATAVLNPSSGGAISVMASVAPALHPEVLVLTDDFGEETIESVARSGEGRFVPLSRTFSVGYSRKVYWLRINLRSDTVMPAHWLLEVGPGYLDDVRLYSPDPGETSGFRERVSGDRLPFALREMAHRLFVFPVDLPSGTADYTLYLRLQSTSTLMAHLTLWEPKAFATATQGEYLALGILLGGVSLMLLYSVVYWYLLRERYLLLFVGLVLSMLIAYVGTNGLAEQLLFPSHPALANVFAPVGSCLLVFFGFWFFLDFLKVQQRHPWLSKLYITDMVLAAIALPGVVFDYYVEIAPVLMACSLLSLPFCLFVAWRSIRLNILGSRWVASAYAWYCLVVGLNLLAVLGLLPGYVFIVYGWQYGAPIYIVFLMSGVLTRVREMERRHDQAVAISIAAEAKAEIAQAQRDEKEKFLSLMAHELKTPLATIDAAVQALGFMPESIDSAVGLRHQRIRGAVSRLNSLLEDSLNLMRSDTDSVKSAFSRRSWIDMDNFLRSLGEGCSTEDALRVEVKQIPGFYGDATLLRLALRNLLDNAFKYGTRGEPITLAVAHQPYAEHEGIIFSVTSGFTGPPDEDCEVWFGKGWRGEHSAGMDGLGLGLYLVREIAEAHGGKAFCQVIDGKTQFVGRCLVASLWIPEIALGAGT